jgi:hypothetical protein
VLVGLIHLPRTWLIAGGIGAAAVAYGGLDPARLPEFLTYAANRFTDGEGAGAGYLSGATASVLWHALQGGIAGMRRGAIAGHIQQVQQMFKELGWVR